MTAAPVTTTVRGLLTEVPVGTANSLEESSVVICDHVTPVPTSALGPQIGSLLDRQGQDLTEAIRAAVELD